MGAGKLARKRQGKISEKEKKGDSTALFSQANYFCGQLCPPPSITTPHVAKVYQSIARPYIILAHAFERGDLKRLNAEIDAANGVWCAVSCGAN